MGVYDTILFDKIYSCPQCGLEINATQTKAFDQSLSDYHIADCISHAEDIRIVKEELTCERCKSFTGKFIYIVVLRGIFVGVSDSLQSAQSMLNDMNQEKLLLWYHDLFKRYREEARERAHALRFMQQVVSWFEKEYHKLDESDITARHELLFILEREYLTGAKDPLVAIKRYLEALKDRQ